MRTQLELMKCSLDRLDLIIKRMQEASDVWRKDLEALCTNESSSVMTEEADEGLVMLSHRIKNGLDIVRVFVSDYVKDAIDLSIVLTKSHSLFKEFGKPTEVKREA